MYDRFILAQSVCKYFFSYFRISHFVIRFLNKIFFVINFSYFGSLSDFYFKALKQIIFLLRYEMYLAFSILAQCTDPYFFFDFQEFSTVIICCSHSCFRINLHCCEFVTAKPQKKKKSNFKEIYCRKKKKKKCHLFCTMQYQTTLTLLLTSKYFY